MTDKQEVAGWLDFLRDAGNFSAPADWLDDPQFVLAAIAAIRSASTPWAQYEALGSFCVTQSFYKKGQRAVAAKRPLTIFDIPMEFIQKAIGMRDDETLRLRPVSAFSPAPPYTVWNLRSSSHRGAFFLLTIVGPFQGRAHEETYLRVVDQASSRRVVIPAWACWNNPRFIYTSSPYLDVEVVGPPVPGITLEGWACAA